MTWLIYEYTMRVMDHFWTAGVWYLGRRFDPHLRQHPFVEIGHEIISTAILSLLLIQEGQLSVPGEITCTSTVKLPRRLAQELCGYVNGPCPKRPEKCQRVVKHQHNNICGHVESLSNLFILATYNILVSIYGTTMAFLCLIFWTDYACLLYKPWVHSVYWINSWPSSHWPAARVIWLSSVK